MRSVPSLTMSLEEVIAELRSRSESVPLPLRLPTAMEVAAMESTLGVVFPMEYRRYLLEASDVVLGTLEPATITDPQAHTHLPEVIASARAYGVPVQLLPICEDNADFYCLAQSGEIKYWSHNGATSESWPNFAAWLQQVWLEERA